MTAFLVRAAVLRGHGLLLEGAILTGCKHSKNSGLAARSGWFRISHPDLLHGLRVKGFTC
jgi:hypothetical protein